MSHLIAIDPGIRYCGWATFQSHNDVDVRLTACGVVRRPPKTDLAELLPAYSWAIETAARRARFDRVAVERMESYPGSSTPANDLIDIAHVAGYLAGYFGGVVSLHYPKAWKGNLPKAQCERRLEAIMEPTGEWAILRGCLKNVPLGEWEHAIDAAGIGLADVGRFNKNGRI